jgi:hypothetical protein
MHFSSRFHFPEKKEFKSINFNKIYKLKKNKEIILPLGSCFLDIFCALLIKKNFKICSDGISNKIINNNYQFFYGNFLNPLNLLNTLERVVLKNWKFNDRDFIYSKKFGHYINLHSKARFNTQDIDQLKKRVFEMDQYLLKEIKKSTIILLCFETIETWISKITRKAWYSFYGNPEKKTTFNNEGEFAILNYEIFKSIIQKIIEIIQTTGKKKIILIKYPHTLWATFAKKDVQVADLYGKSTMLAAFSDLECSNVSYFPAFEILNNLNDKKKFQKDFLHIKREVIKNNIIPVFEDLYF